MNKFYTTLEIDYNKKYYIAEILAYHQNVLPSPHYISPRFAIFLFSKQVNQFQFKNKIFYYNNIPIQLFDDFEVIKKKFPEKNLICDIENSCSLAEGVSLNFTTYNDKKYLVNIYVNLKLLYQQDDNDFGIFLYDGFPLNGTWYSDKEFKDLLNKFNDNVNNKFSYERTYTYTTKFENVNLENLIILQNYFTNKEKFERTNGKIIKNRMIMNANQIQFTNQLTYDRIDSQSDLSTPPSGN